MTPDELRALTDAATPTEDEFYSWSRAVDAPGEGWERREPVDELVQLAPDLARLVVEMADLLATQAWRPDPLTDTINATLAKLAELEVR